MQIEFVFFGVHVCVPPKTPADRQRLATAGMANLANIGVNHLPNWCEIVFFFIRSCPFTEATRGT